MSKKRLPKYDEHFNKAAVAKFQKERVPASYANNFPKRFTPLAVCGLHERDINPEQALEYDQRFYVGGIIGLLDEGISADSANGYDGRFKWRDVAELMRREVDASVANAYDDSFSVQQILLFLESDVAPEQASEYVGLYAKEEMRMLDKRKISVVNAANYAQRFEACEVVELTRIGCSPEFASQYAERFDGMNIASLIRKNVPPEIANAYPETLESYFIGDYFKEGALPDMLDQFKDENFSVIDMLYVIASGKTIDEIRRYDTRFSSWGVATLVKEGVSPEKAQEYDRRFSGNNIADLFIAGVSPEKAQKYNSRFDAFDIKAMAKQRVSPKKAEQYAERFSGFDIATLVKSKVTSETAASYDKRFDANDIARLVLPRNAYDIEERSHEEWCIEEGCPEDADILPSISPSRAARFDKRFDGGDIVWLVRSQISPSVAKRYNPDFSGFTIARLVYREVTPKQADRLLVQYDSRFDKWGAIELLHEGVDPESANKYQSRFKAQDIVSLRDGEYHDFVSSEQARAYDSQYSGDDVLSFVWKNVSATDANDCLEEFEGLPIANLTNMGVELSNLQEANQFPILSMLGVFEEDIARYRVKDLGNRTAILEDDIFHKSYKFSQDLKNEIAIHRFIREKGLTFENVAGLAAVEKPRIEEGIIDIIEIDRFEGDTLFDILEDHPDEVFRRGSMNVLRFGDDICNGILELHSAGIYHRDLHDRNVMQNKDRTKAVIIDLGVATRDPTEVHPLNRAYGGNNDLVSLGQLMYKIVTGNNLFNEDEGFTCYSEVKEDIKTEREMTYDDPEKKAAMLDNVRQDLPDDVQDMVVCLLDDELWTQPSLERVKAAKKRFYDHPIIEKLRENRRHMQEELDRISDDDVPF